jgi:hypothetical protein
VTERCTATFPSLAVERSRRADQILPNDRAYVADAGGPLSQWLNPLAFALPALGTVGNYHRDNVVHPSIWQFDIALSRAFRITDRQRLEVRADAFKVTNSLHPGTPPTSFTPGGTTLTNVSNPLFGQIRTAADPRIMQSAMKYFKFAIVSCVGGESANAPISDNGSYVMRTLPRVRGESENASRDAQMAQSSL